MQLTSLRIKDFSVLALFKEVEGVARIIYTSVVVRFWLKHQIQVCINELFLKNAVCITQHVSFKDINDSG